MVGKLDRPGTESSWWYEAGLACAPSGCVRSARLRCQQSERWTKLRGSADGGGWRMEDEDGETENGG